MIKLTKKHIIFSALWWVTIGTSWIAFMHFIDIANHANKFWYENLPFPLAHYLIWVIYRGTDNYNQSFTKKDFIFSIVAMLFMELLTFFHKGNYLIAFLGLIIFYAGIFIFSLIQKKLRAINIL